MKKHDIDWRDHLQTKINVEEYTIYIRTQKDTLAFIIHYVKHNGYTVLKESVAWPLTDISDDGKEFKEWLAWHSEFNTRYDKVYWWKPIRFNRKKKLVLWAVKAIDKAYSAWYQEKVKEMAK